MEVVVQVFTNKVIPVDLMLRGEKPDLAKIKRDAKLHPWYFAGELFAVVMMIVGAVATCGWLYELGREVGRSL
jgi:hypothetical protein